MRRGLWLLLALPLVLAAAPSSYDDPESLLRRADSAFAAGRAEEAAELYDKAGVRTTNPSLAAYNLATVRYRQAKEGNLSALGAAEVNYRACLRPGDEFRARALFGLGNCLLIRATGATVDRATLRAAMDRYAECLADASCDDELRAQARHNRAKARLLLLQTPPAPEEGSEPPGDEKKDDKDDQQPKKDKKEPANGSEDGAKKDKDRSAKADKDKEAKENKDGEAGGKSKMLPPPPEDGEAPPLARQDAEKHLEAAMRRIRDEAMAHRRSKARPAGPGVKDW